jgi:lysophospholipase L1-like esterase
MRGRATLLALATSVVALALGLAILEGGVRLLEMAGFFAVPVFANPGDTPLTRRSENPILGWELDPSAPGVNSAGFRDQELALGKHPDRTRIALLGDSVAFGYGLPPDQGVADRLEAELGEGYEVLNCGVVGYNTQQTAELYARSVRPFQPDVVVLLYVLNDAVPAAQMIAFLNRVAQKPSATGPAPPAGLHALARLGEAFERLRGLDPEELAPYVHESHEDEASWSTVDAGLARIGSIAREDGAGLLLAITPHFFDLDDYAFADVHEQVALAARLQGFAVVDLRQSLRGTHPVALRLDPGDVTHPSPLGHQLMAAAIARELRRSSSP